MNKNMNIIFLSIFLALSLALNAYIIIRGLPALPKITILRILFVVIILALSISYAAGRVFENILLCQASTIIIIIGSIWIAFTLYFFLSALAIDILRLSNLAFHWLPGFITFDTETTRKIITLAVIVITSFAIAIGYFNSQTPIVVKFNIETNKITKGADRLKIIMVSDIHLGNIIQNTRLEKMVGIINSLNPDLILLVGDIVDEDLKPIIDLNMGEELLRLKARHGVFAVTGNHEYIGGVNDAVKYLKEHNINVLRDEIVELPELILIGRDDLMKERFTGIRRKPLNYLVKNVNMSKMLVLMDHQPYKLREASINQIDLQLSGHTHHGQLWPLNFITSKIYEVSRGFYKIGSTNYYVSCGFGTWGPPVRLGSRPEIVEITVVYK
jgi:hypothetical protein